MKWTAAIAITITTLGALSIAISFLFYPVARLLLGLGNLTGINSLFSSSLKKVSRESLSANKHLFSYKTTLNGLNVAKNAVITKSLSLYGGLKKLPGTLSEIIKNARHLSFWLNGLKMILRVAFSPIRMILLGIGSVLGFLLSPIGLLATALVSAGILIYRNWEKVRSFFGGFWESLKAGLAPVIEKFKPLGDLFGGVVGWIEKAVKWFTDLLSPVQSTQKDLDSAASAGKKFGEWVAKGIELALTPLTLLKEGIEWIIKKLPSMEKMEKAMSNAMNNSAAGNYFMQGLGMDIPEKPKWNGGYAGNGGKYEPKGIYHGGEYIMTKEATSRLGVPLLNALNYGKKAVATSMLGLGVAAAQPVNLQPIAALPPLPKIEPPASIDIGQPIKMDTRPPLSAKPQAAQIISQPMQVTITIHAAQGQSEADIAKEVQKQLAAWEQKRQAKLRSRLQDNE